MFGPQTREHWVCLYVGSSVQSGVTRGIAGIFVVSGAHAAYFYFWGLLSHFLKGACCGRSPSRSARIPKRVASQR